MIDLFRWNENFFLLFNFVSVKMNNNNERQCLLAAALPALTTPPPDIAEFLKNFLGIYYR